MNHRCFGQVKKSSAKNFLASLGLLLVFSTMTPAFAAVNLSQPASNALYLAPAAMIPVRANASASGGLTVDRVEFYANGNLIHTDTTSPYQFDWTNVAAGTYVITAKMVDSASGETTSAPRTINVAASNTPPTVSLTGPANNASYISPSSVTVSATAAGPELNDLLQRVEFHLNGSLAATVTTPPYTTSLSGLADGTYTLTAIAVDGQGAPTTSSPRSFTIGQNQPPTVSITTPLDNSNWHSPAGFMFQVQAAAPETNDTLTVEFYANGNLIGTRTSAPWSINTSGLTAGTYVLTAKAIDGQGANTTSAARTITVSDTNNAPIVSITAPAANANFPAPAPSIAITANANAGEVNGHIQRVEFYVNGNLTNTDTAGPWTFAMTNVPAGSYVLTAKAVDQLNAETTSAPITVTVGAASIHFIHTDHLNTPRVITNQAQQVVWRYDNTDPFGGNVPDENPSGLGNFSCNLRLPGQYFDKETNLHYNYFRDYDPAIGRYVQSDPIGLEGGVNTYAYVGSNPLSWVDPDGLLTIVGCNRARNQQLMTAVFRVQRAVERCVACSDRAAFRKRLDDLAIHCTTSDEAVDETGRPIRFCGAANRNNPNLYISPSGFTNPKCGCLQALVIHEVSHSLSNPYTDRPGDPRNAYDLARRCFSCSD